MSDTIFNLLNADIALNLTLPAFLLILLTTALCGALFSALYVYTHKDGFSTGGLPLALIVVPISAAIVILLVGRNIATALGLGGIFVLVRFRSGPVETKDLSYLFAAICNGVLAGCGYVAYDILFSVLMCGLMYAIYYYHWGEPAGNPMLLKVWIPETLDFEGVFEPVLDKYCDTYQLLMVRTTDFGSLCELRYHMTPKAGMKQKELLDNIRIRNGNMNVVLVTAPTIVTRQSKQVL